MALSWSDISSQAWFTELAPEQKAKALDVWTQDTLSSVTDPAEREQLEAASEFGKLKYLGQPLPAQSLEEFVPIFQEQKRLKAADEQGLLTQLGGALQTGLRDVTTGLGVTFDALTGDNEELAQGLAAMNETDAVRQQNKTTQDIQFEKALAENAQQFKDAKGFWPTTKELADYVGITLSNPTAFAKMVAESAPNALVSIGAQAVGAGVGALAAGAGGGVATGGAGAIPAAFAGGTAGAVAANVPLEIPGSIRQKFLEVTKGEGAKMTPEQIKQVLDANPEIISEGALKGTVRGTAIGVVEGLTAGVAGKVATIPERAAERAVLAETAKRLGKEAATRLDAADYILKNPGAKDALAEVASKALSDFTVGQRVASLAGGGVIESIGEGAGEAAAQVATGEEIDPTAIYQEVAAGLGMAGASTALARSIEPARQIVQRINASPELQAEKQNLTAAENLVQQAAADPNTVASVAAAKAVINQGDQNLVEKAATAVAQEFQVSPDITSGITDLGEAEGDIRTSIPLQTPQGAELPATEAALAGQPFTTETLFQPADLESGLTEVPPISPADITAGLQKVEKPVATIQASVQDAGMTKREEELSDDKFSTPSEIKVTASLEDRGLTESGREIENRFAPTERLEALSTPDEQRGMREAASGFAYGKAVRGEPLTQREVASLPIRLPEGYVRQGDLYVFAPEAPTKPQPPTQTTEDATLQGQVPENRIEERVQADEGGPTAETGGGNRPVIGGQVQGEVQTDEVTIPPQGVVPTESLPEGQVTPGGAAVPSVRDTTKPEQMTPEELDELEAQAISWANTPDDQIVARYQKEFKASDAFLAAYPFAPENWRKTQRRMVSGPPARGSHKKAVQKALSDRKKVSAEAVDTYGITLPEGYVKQGDLYVFAPEATAPTAPQVSPEIRNTLQAEITSLPPVAQTRWTPDVVADAESYIQTGNQDAYKRLTRPQQNLVNRVRERLGITDEQDAQEAEMERQMRLDANTKGSPYRNQIEQSIDLPVGDELGMVSEADFEAGMRIVEGLIRNARATVIQDTRANLLASADLNEAEKDAFRRGAQGIYSRGRAIIARDNIRATSFTASPAQAAAAVVFHELMHKGSDILKSDPRFAQEYADWLQMLNENVTDDMIRDVVARTGYRNMADWQTNPTSKLRAQEEVFVRQMERFFQRGGRLAPAQAGLLARFKEWIGRVVERALGTPIAGNLRDDILQDWGRKFIKAVQSSNAVSDADLAASIEFPSAPTPETRTGVDRISTFDEDEKAALRSFMKGDQGFDKLKQFLGVEEGGELGRTESLLPLKMAAIDTIGFSEDKSGAPVVSKRATENAFEIARQLLDPTTNFGVTYQQEVGEGAESAATAVLQMELIRYALAMARKGDNRLLATLRQNWNSVVLGAYITATASGRILRARADYVSDVLRTIDKMDAEAKKQAKKRLQSLGMDEKEAEATVRDLDAVIQQTRLTEEQLNDLARALETSPEGRAFEKEKPAEDWAGRAVSRLQPENQRLVNQFFRELFELDQAAKKLEEISKTPNGPEASFLDSFVTDDITLPDSQEELQEFIQTKEKKIADILGKLLPRAKTDPAVAEALAKVTKPAKAKKPVQPADATSTGSENDDVSSAEDVNEATKAAAKIIDNLKAFLDKKFTKKAPKPSVYQKIKALVDKAIANPENYDFEKFQEEADKDLKSFDIDEEVQEELVAKAFTVFSRYQQKEAESIAASLIKEKVEKGPTIPEKAQDLKATVRKYLVNKERLEAAQFRSKMTDEITKIGGIEAKTIESLVNATYNRFVKNRQAQVAKKVAAVKKALLSGSRDALAKRMLADKGADPTDATWRREAMHVLLKNSGLTPLEALEAYNAMSKKDIDTIFKVSAKMAAEMEIERTNKRVAEIIRKYEKELATPKEEAQKQQDNLRNLTKTQMRVPLELDVFKAEAARFGATPEQAERLFNLARVEADLIVAETGKTPTMLGKLVRYIQSVPNLAKDPQGRSIAIEGFLRDNGYSEEQIARSKTWIEKAISKKMVEAKQAALDRMISRAEKKTQQKLTKKAEEDLATRLGGITGKAREILMRDLKTIRSGLGDKETDPSMKLAEALGFSGFRPNDYKSLAELDIKITQANLEGRLHDASAGVIELYELLNRRKAPKNLVEQLGIAYNYGALSSLGSLAIQVISPLGAFVTRFTMDMTRALARRDINLMKLTVKSFIDSLKRVPLEAAYGLKGGASTVNFSQQIFAVTRLSQEMSNAADTLLRRGRQSPERRKERGLSPRPNALEMVKAGYSWLLTSSQIIGRVLSTADHVANNMMKNYFTKTEAAKALLAGTDMPYEAMVARLFNISTTVNAQLSYEKDSLTKLAMEMKQLKEDGKYSKAALLDLLAAPLPEGLSQSAQDFERDLRGNLRRVVEAYDTVPKLERHILREMSRQKTAAETRANDRMRVELLRDIEGRVTPQAAAQVQDFAAKETDYEMGTHRGENAPTADIFNTFTNLVRDVGQSVKSRHPLLGTMVLGYFGIPVNLLNRAMWFTPWGLVRAGLFKNAQRNGLTKDTYYQMSMATTAQFQQRLMEAIGGTAAVALLMALKGMDDDEDEGFNVTLSGPSNKTEFDAWSKQGHRKGSLEYVSKDGTVTSLNWARGLFEPLKVALLMVGAMDDMRLNRKIGEQATGLGTTISEYLSAVLYGWSKQAAFFGAKNTIGTFLAPAVDSNAVAGSLYKLGPLVPYNGLISSVEKFIAGPDRFYGREGAIWLNLPIARSLMTERAVNALGDPQGFVANTNWSDINDRAWYAGMPLMVTGSPTGNDKKVYDFILQRGTGPGLPQRGNLEEKNGLMSDTKWLEFVRTRGQILKTDMIRNMPRLEALDDEALTRAYSDMSEQATRIAKRRMGFQ